MVQSSERLPWEGSAALCVSMHCVPIMRKQVCHSLPLPPLTKYHNKADIHHVRCCKDHAIMHLEQHYLEPLK